MPDKNRPLSVPDIVLFDLDGTLYQYSPVALNFQTFVNKFRFLFKEISKSKKPSKSGEKKFAENTRPSLGYALGRLLTRPRPLDGVEKFLAYLVENDIGRGIASNASPQWGPPLLEKFDLAKYFTACTFRNSEMQLKPAPDCLLATIEQVKAVKKKDPKIVWYIGDMALDIEAAINAGNSAVSYEVVPVAIGSKTSAARKLQELQSAGAALNGLIFGDYAQMLLGLQQVMPSSNPQSLPSPSSPVA